MRTGMKMLVVLAYSALFMALLTILFMLTGTRRMDIWASLVVIAVMIATSLLFEVAVARSMK